METILCDCCLKLKAKATVKKNVVYFIYRQQFLIVAKFTVAKSKKCCSVWFNMVEYDSTI